MDNRKSALNRISAEINSKNFNIRRIEQIKELLNTDLDFRSKTYFLEMLKRYEKRLNILEERNKETERFFLMKRQNKNKRKITKNKYSMVIPKHTKK